MLSYSPCHPPEAAVLDHIAAELTRVRERLHDLHATARSLASLTDWQARAATVFHERADDWARDVSKLGQMAETAHQATVRASDRVALESVTALRCA